VAADRPRGPPRALRTHPPPEESGILPLVEAQARPDRPAASSADREMTSSQESGDLLAQAIS